jgi:RNA polymerase-binding protein DksA
VQVRAGVAGPNDRKETAMEQKKTPLTDDELKHFREALRAKRRELLGNVEDLTTEMDQEHGRNAQAEQSAAPSHPADRSSDTHDRDISLAHTQRERDLLFEVDEALKRIENGTYGRCLEGEKVIPKPRLEAKPWARFCLEHAREHEPTEPETGF